jgi:hypothetical protein
MDLREVLEKMIQLKEIWNITIDLLNSENDDKESASLEKQAIEIEILIEKYEKLQKTIREQI